MKLLNVMQYLSIGAFALILSMPLSTAPQPQTSKQEVEVEISGKKSKKLFKEFINNFPKTELPYTLDQAALAKYNVSKEMSREEMVAILKKNVIPSKYVAYVPALNQGKFSRMGPSTFRFEQLIIKNKDIIAVVLSENRGYRMNPAFSIYTYSTKGKLLGQQRIGWYYYDQIMMCSIDKNLNIEVKNYDIDRSKNEKMSYQETIPKNLLKLRSTTNYVLDKKEGIKEGKKYASVEQHQVQQVAVKW